MSNISTLNIILDNLICPYCTVELLYIDNCLICQNNKCNKIFPIINGIPIIINEDESIFNISDFISGKDTFFHTPHSSNFIKARFIKILKQLVPKIGNNISFKNNFYTINNLLSENFKSKILILGGGIISYGTEMLFNEKNTIIESDISFAPRTQVIIDSHNIPYKSESFDCVIFQAVLEHVADPNKCVAEAHRVLKKNGIVYATTPFMQQVHGGAYDFTRFTHLGHRRLFRRFEEIESGICAGSGVALAWSIKYFFRSLSDNKIIQKMMEFLIPFLCFWIKYFDLLTKNKKSSFDSASVYYFIGKKSNNTMSDKELIRQYKGNY